MLIGAIDIQTGDNALYTYLRQHTNKAYEKEESRQWQFPQL